MNIKAGFDTILPADSVEFCPHPDFLALFVCGTYKLEQPDSNGVPLGHEEETSSSSAPKRQHRSGQCLLFQVESVNEESFSLKQRVSLPAILDMKWCHRAASATPILGIADSEGNITIHEVDSQATKLKRIQSISCAPSEILCLSLDWSNRRVPTTTLGPLVVSLSDGSLTILRPQDQSGLTMTDSWAAHDFEPWIAAWDYWDTNVVYSGGDDLKFKGWDTRQGFSQPLFVNKCFDGGVTTIQSHPHSEHHLAVGSYDKILRIFDTRNIRAPVSEFDVGGGIWRVKWHPSPRRASDILVACMHDGFKVVRLNVAVNGAKTLLSQVEIVKRFDAHESLA
ncbi:Diphthine methyltransferase [Sparassis crispa]|uniref:methylated diphthine methylhydrolase n=1 Tax=Sparassis crispa TaxID=139825 RepID=A0A401G713_9APHY|nr:Diphthine methyltransferase [Sparassis crispa]GBE77939.1 Diphthine methyltransferase [Sparassis crispa]